ncbi:MAG: protoporphyrinogen oxidase [Chlamydiia bacterium]|nr:protoporphyrinogen oxidase [Chlamydiia bacterium]
MNIVILGGGISGLSAAWYVQQKYPHAAITLLEKSHRLGGWIQTYHGEGVLFELGPRTFQTARCSHLLALIQEMGLSNEVIYSDPAAGCRYLLYKGHLRSMASFIPMLIPGCIRDLFAAKTTVADESIYDFAKRRFGERIANTLFDPLTLGIYAGDIHKLSIRSCFPHFVHLEKQWRSIVLGSLLSKKWGQKRGLFTLRQGMQHLIQALAEKIHANIYLNTTVEAIRHDGVVANGRLFPAELIISALPGSVLGKLTGLLPEFEETDLWVVNLAFDGAILPKKGFGYLAPTQEKEKLLGMIWDSSVFPQQSCGLQTRVTAMMREGSVPLALDAARRHLQITASPSFSNVFFAQNAIPQFPVGYSQRLAEFEKKMILEFPHLFCCGNYLQGASVDACIARAMRIFTHASYRRLAPHKIQGQYPLGG